MNFTKMTGAGNDFIVLGTDRALPLKPETIRRLCDRRYGIGADGLMVISGPAGRGTGSAFYVDFYNADGSGGMLCGNGARCTLVYAAGHGLIAYGELATFSFAGKLYSGMALDPGHARFMLDPRYFTRLEDRVQAGTFTARGRYIDLGSLHFVVDLADLATPSGTSGDHAGRHVQSPVQDLSHEHMDAGTLGAPSLEHLDVGTIGVLLRHHERFAPLGVNVNFCSLRDGRIHVRTFERGVEGETLACGTGSTASALSYALRGLVTPPVRVVTRSGEELIIDFDDPTEPSRLSLEGPAMVVFEGQADPAYFMRGS